MKKQPEIRHFFLDEQGHNRIIMHHSEKTVVLYIKLQSEGGRSRKVGVITKSTKTLKITRKRDKHLFRKLNAYGFNEYVLANGKSFDKIWLKDDFNEWKIPVDFILKEGEYLNFKAQGFELQKFISLEKIEQFKVKKKENRRF